MLGPHFDEFLSTLNRNRSAVYPQAEADITLPKKLTERDRAFLAHGLVAAIDPGAKVAEYFDVPGYLLKQFDDTGGPMRERIRTNLSAKKILADGKFHVAAFEISVRSVRAE